MYVRPYRNRVPMTQTRPSTPYLLRFTRPPGSVNLGSCRSKKGQSMLTTIDAQNVPAVNLFVTGQAPMKCLGTDVGRMARDLNVLFKIAKTINSLRTLESFGGSLLQLIGEV